MLIISQNEVTIWERLIHELWGSGKNGICSSTSNKKNHDVMRGPTLPTILKSTSNVSDVSCCCHIHKSRVSKQVTATTIRLVILCSPQSDSDLSFWRAAIVYLFFAEIMKSVQKHGLVFVNWKSLERNHPQSFLYILKQLLLSLSLILISVSNYYFLWLQIKCFMITIHLVESWHDVQA